MASPALSVRGVKKRFGGVHALKGVTVQLYPGEVLGIVGDNGAGKSTLVKIIGGVVKADEGLLELGSRSYPTNPLEVQKAGVRIVYQDLALCGNVNAVANIYLGREQVKWGWLGPLAVRDETAMRAAARAAITELGLVSSEDLDVPVRNLSGGQQQVVAIARAIFEECTVLILDEPTAALGVTEREHVLSMIRHLADTKAIAIGVISHNIDELLSVADRVVALRHGWVVGRFDGRDTSVVDVVAAIVGGAPLPEDHGGTEPATPMTRGARSAIDTLHSATGPPGQRDSTSSALGARGSHE